MNSADAITARAQAEAESVDAASTANGAATVVGHIIVRVEPGEDSISIAVEDDGTGLPQGEERDRLAEPYVTHKVKGTGLGLAIVKKIMEDHGGRLALEDRPHAAGSGCGGARAILTLPWRPGVERPARAETEANDHWPDDSMRRAHGA
jgi:two-component system nitrogen regulation sensor histidine kinase NtrY